MKTTTMRVLCLAGLAAGSLAASGGAFARDNDYHGPYREVRYEQRYEQNGRFDRYDHYDHGSYGRRHEVVVTRYESHPRYVERRVIVERPVYVSQPVVAYAPPPSIGQVIGGLIGGVIDENSYNR
jgi:hypothetical protein